MQPPKVALFFQITLAAVLGASVFAATSAAVLGGSIRCDAPEVGAIQRLSEQPERWLLTEV